MSETKNFILFSKLPTVILSAILGLLALLVSPLLFVHEAGATNERVNHKVAATLPPPTITFSNTVVVADYGGESGLGASTAIVNGKPAIAYFNDSYESLMYVQAADENGTSWNEPITIETQKGYLDYINLIVVDGKPAIAYRETASNNSNSAVKFVTSADANGTSWGSPIIAVDSTSRFDGLYLSLAIIDGKPAVSYQSSNPANSNDRSLRFTRANDTAGTSWGSPEVVDTVGQPGSFSSLASVNGKPAIAYYRLSGQDLVYAQAFDAAGNSWKTPLVVDSAGIVGIAPQLEVVDNRPAIAYQDLSNRDTKYVRAADADGDSWGAPVIVDSNISINGVFSAYLTMGIIAGKPAIINSQSGELRYYRAVDSTGSSWNSVLNLQPAIVRLTSL